MSVPASPVELRGGPGGVYPVVTGDGRSALGLERPLHEDALAFGAARAEPRREGTIVFLHDPWPGLSRRRDVVALWVNAGRREIGLDDFDGRWPAGVRFGFVRPHSSVTSTA